MYRPPFRCQIFSLDIPPRTIRSQRRRQFDWRRHCDRLVYFFRQKTRAHCRATRNRLHPHEGQTYGTRPRPPQQSTTFSNSIGGGEKNIKDGHSAAVNRSSRRTFAQGIQERVQSGLLDYFFVALSEQNLVHEPSKRSKEDFLSSSL